MSIIQERKLLSGIIVVAKSRPEFDIKDAIRNMNFHHSSSISLSSGFMIMLSGKSQVLPSVL